MIYLADTHVLLWAFENPDRLSPAQHEAWRAARAGTAVRVSDITLWEIATLVHLERIRLALPLRVWLDKAVAPPLVELVRMTPAIAAEVAALPRTFHRDPADRTIVATARVLGATLLTSDGPIIESGLVPTL